MKKQATEEPKGIELKEYSIFNIQHSILFLVLSLCAIWGFLTIFAPKPYTPPLKAATDYDLGPMLAAMSPEAVRETLDEVTAFGSRSLGSKGFYDCEALIRRSYQDGGLELYEQSLRTVAPQTEFAEALEADGKPASFNVYSFVPNHYQPVATPDEGVTATVLRVDDEMLRVRSSFEGCFALLDTSRPLPTGYLYDYKKYAQLGFAGVIVSHPDGLAAVPWSLCKYMVSVNPLNYLRVAAGPGIFDYVGRQVTLRVRDRYRHVPVRTIVGVLRAGREAEDALIIPCSYGARSRLTNLAPGPVDALSVAMQLRLVKGLQAYRADLRRDVIFVAFGGSATGSDVPGRFLSTIGGRSQGGRRAKAMQTEQADNAGRLHLVDTCTAVLTQEAVLTDASATRKAFAALDGSARGFLDEQIQYVLDSLVFERSEDVLRAKIVFEKTDAAQTDSAEFAAYQAAKKEYDKAFSAAGFDPVRLLEEQADFAAEAKVRDRVVRRFRELRDYHVERATLCEQNLRINALFSGYENLMVFAPQLVPVESDGSSGERLTFTMGNDVDHRSGGQAAYESITRAIQQLDLNDEVDLRFAASRRYGNLVHERISRMNAESAMWAKAGYPAYSVVHDNRFYKAFNYPVALPWTRNTESVGRSMQVFGSTIVFVGLGNTSFVPLKFSAYGVNDYCGNAYVANVGQSIIPNYPLAGALVGCKPKSVDNVDTITMLMTDPYGRYEYRYRMNGFFVDGNDYGPEAVGFDDDGVIRFIKDEGAGAQRIYVSMRLKAAEVSDDVNIVCFRASPVSLPDLINPQSLKSYNGATFIRRQGLTEFESMYALHREAIASEGMLTTFIAPDEYFYVELKAGAPGNELVHTTRAFLLGPEAAPDDAEEVLSARPGSEIRGRGYLAAETPMIRDVAAEAARSMIAVNDRRLAVQDHYGMADERTREFQDRAGERLRHAEKPELAHKRAKLAARDAVTYSTLNHPILRSNIFEAVAGILWYLGLLVPFTFFFEKLVFGFPDVRKQLGAHVVIFLTVFLLLKLLHPAFAMIRSSLMILLGFIILLISVGILAMFSSKFKENLESIKQQRGRVTAAEVNKFGAIVTAFMLGLNNMHRRRVRTMLTCGTLVLITFVMICFTSVQSDLVDTAIAIGKAPFQGFVLKNEEFRSISGAELFALQTKYGEQCAVSERRTTTGSRHWQTREREYPELRLTREDGETTRAANALAMLTLMPDEPLAEHLVPPEQWFTKAETVTGTDAPVPAVISEAIAAKLGIMPDMLGAENPVAFDINGVACTVRGIFSGNALDALLDLDGYNLLPFDIKALREVNLDENTILADEEDPRISGDDAIIVPRSLGITIPNGGERITSVAVALPDTLPPREAREVVRQFMEQSGRLTYFGLDGFAFLGQRARKSTFVGLVDMLIPLIIAAITVLNTIRGSVYERKEEIFVYNAVGIAPKHIFFMFFAEAFVYAVVGSVLGYILSQGTGRFLTAIDLTGGLNMTFTSLGTIYASLTIAASVFVSTWFPARTAMKIASPSEDLGWHLPEPEGDGLRLQLPFTFDWRDRIAVLAFFRRYFVDHGEGSSGPFFAGPPEMGVAGETDPLNDDGYIPTITVPIWLKPFDLGVSQELRIAMPTDSETGEFVADITLTRRSGTLENWKRLNQVFIGLVRTHFLHWRAVGQEERAGMFTEARGELKIEN